MTRLFLSRKDPSQEETNVSKRRFTFFRRGQSDVAPGSPTTASMSLSPPPSPARSLPLHQAPPPSRRSLFTPVPVEKKTQSFRISVYEVRKDDLTDTCSSSGSDQEIIHARERRQAPVGKAVRSKSPLPVPKKSLTRKAPQRTVSDPFFGSSESGPRGILKRGLFAAPAPTRPTCPTPVTSFDLHIARQSTSFADAASTTDDSKVSVVPPLKKSPARQPSFGIPPKRTVSFSADVRDPKPRTPTMYSMCWGGKPGRRVPRKSFSLFNEFEDLSYDLTYFCRCIADVATSDGKGNDLLTEDDSTVGSGSLLGESSLDNPMIQASVTM